VPLPDPDEVQETSFGGVGPTVGYHVITQGSYSRTGVVLWLGMVLVKLHLVEREVSVSVDTATWPLLSLMSRRKL